MHAHAHTCTQKKHLNSITVSHHFVIPLYSLSNVFFLIFSANVTKLGQKLLSVSSPEKHWSDWFPHSKRAKPFPACYRWLAKPTFPYQISHMTRRDQIEIFNRRTQNFTLIMTNWTIHNRLQNSACVHTFA